MRTEKDIKKEIALVMGEFRKIKAAGLRATKEMYEKRAELNKKLRELRAEQEAAHKQKTSEWLEQLQTLELEGEKKQVIDIYKMCVRNKIKARAVFGRIEDGKFIYYDPKWNRDKTEDVPTEFSASMTEGLDFEKYEKIKSKIVPKGYRFENLVGSLAEEYGFKL